MEEMLFFLAGVLLSGGICLLIFRKRENRLMDSVQHMIDQAIDGKFQTDRVDESKMSAVENGMKRFLDDSLAVRQDQYRQKETIQTLISDISHQTVTPIANIKLYLELLEEKLPSPAEELEAVKEQSDKLDFLIQSLVKLSRLETGILAVRPSRHPVEELLTPIRIQYACKAEEKGIDLQVEESPIWAKFDVKWTAEAVGNMVDNALKYTPRGGHVAVKARAYPFFVRIDIQDDGMGIAEEEQAKIFTRFYRSRQAESEPGVGIGLYLAREIIQSQKGYVKVSSRKGEGALFSVFLPSVPNVSEV